MAAWIGRPGDGDSEPDSGKSEQDRQRDREWNINNVDWREALYGPTTDALGTEEPTAQARAFARRCRDVHAALLMEGYPEGTALSIAVNVALHGHL